MHTGGPAVRGQLRLTWALLAALPLVACTSSGPASAPSRQVAPTAAVSPSTAVESAAPVAEWTAPAQFQALWPETAASQVPATLPSWRRSPEQTARRFAGSVFGWGDPQVAASRFDARSHADVYTLARADGAPRIEVHLKRMVDAEHWSVTYFWGFGEEDPSASVSVTPEKAYVGFDYWGDATSAQLLLRYGNHQVERTSQEEAEWKVPIDFPLDTTGAVMVLFRDAQGRVFTGWGTSLPAGNFAAG